MLKFRHLREAKGLTQKIFEAINAHLAAKGLMMREGTIVDATLIAAPPSTKNKDGERDPEMHQSKKGNDWHFGMKAIGKSVIWHVAMKRAKRKALPKNKLGRMTEKLEHLKASVRAKVEHPFHVIMNLFRHRKTRYRGLAKNTAQLFTLFGSFLPCRRKTPPVPLSNASWSNGSWKRAKL